MILPFFINGSQSDLVKDRRIGDNAHFPHELGKNYHSNHTSPQGMIKADTMKAVDSVKSDFVLSILQTIKVPENFL